MRLRKISKRTAKRFFDEGRSIYILPSKVALNAALNGAWVSFYEINKDTGVFDKIINSYSYYNCNSELGNYVKYYVEDI